ncbi:MAG: serine hydrolase [Oscillospiraceae bacterium]|nr:serine hydrolase [Oscillospiraceae bacterium]
MIKRIAILLILIPATLLFSYQPAIASSQFLGIVAQGAILAEPDSGKILFGHNINTQHPADGLARVMTLLLVVEAVENGEADVEEMIEMTASAWEGLSAANTTLNIREGEVMPLIDLMYAAFVSGAAEACNRIAEHIAGSVDTFVARMNAMARQLGAENTNFVNTHGQHSPAQVTTAHDQFIIYSEAIGSELFLEISGVFRHTLEPTNTSDERRLLGSNSLVNTGPYFSRGNKSGIGSITFEGGHSYVGASEIDGLTLIAVVLGSNEVMRPDGSVDLRNLSEAGRLFDWGYSQFDWFTILSPSQLVARARIEHGAGIDYVILRPDSEVRLLLDRDTDFDEFVRTITIFSEENDEPLIAPVEAGEVLGEITIVRDGVEFGPIALVANTNVDLDNFEFMRRQFVDIASSDTVRYVLWGLAGLIVIYLILVIRYNARRRRRLSRIAQAKRQLAEERRHALEVEEEERAAYYGVRQTRPGHAAYQGTGLNNTYPGSGSRQLSRGSSSNRQPPRPPAPQGRNGNGHDNGNKRH